MADTTTAPEKVKRPNRATQIRLDMEAAGIYSPADEATIRDLVKREHELRRAEKAWKAAYFIDGKQQEPQMTVQLINKAGAPYMTPDPYYKQVETLRSAVASLRDQLGLTPRARKRLKANVSESDAGGKSRLETLLEQAEDYAVDHAAEYATEVDAYADGVLSGELVACKTIVQSCERYRRDLASGKWDFRPEPACYIIAVIETLICHQRGQFLDATPLRGKPFLLLPYHKFIIFNVMGFYKPGTDERRFKEVLDFVPRKNIKTTLAAALAFALALYERRSGSEVYIVGGALKQARQSFDFLGYNLHRLRVTADEDPTHGLRMIDNNAEHSFSGDVGDGYVSISALASNPDKQDSFNANIILADEMHSYKSAMQYQVLQDATQAYTNKLVIGISSGGRYAQGFCAKHVAYCRKVLSGEVTGAAADEIFIFIASIGDDENGNPAYLDERELQGANPGWGASIRPQEMLNMAQRAKDDPQRRTEFLQKRCNRFTAELKAYFDVEEWRRSDAAYHWTIADVARMGIKWYGGSDLSKLHDLTAACLFGHHEGVDILLPHCWFPRTAAYARAEESKIPLFGWADDGWLTMTNGAVTNHHEVVQWYKAMRDKGFKIRLVGHDRKFAQEYFLDMRREKFRVKDIPQTYLRKSAGFCYLRDSAKRGTLYYLHAEPMEYCVGNVLARECVDDAIQYEKISPEMLIDVFDAAVFACMAYLDDLEAAQKNQGWFDSKETA